MSGGTSTYSRRNWIHHSSEPRRSSPHMSFNDELKENLGQFWIPTIYEEKIRPKRTRAFSMNIPEKANTPEILHTLLGVELKVGKVRISCPDLATARYLQVFARLGVRDVAIPYDISRISSLADDLETGWQRMSLLLAEAPTRIRNGALRSVREAVNESGPGDAMPAFDTQTRQRTAK